MDDLLVISDLSKRFTLYSLNKQILALDPVSLTVRHGEFVGITGRSGSGKTTLLKSIYRTYRPQAGCIWYDSAQFGPLDLTQASERQIIYLRRYEIGYVSQFLSVMPRTTALEIVEQAALEMDLNRALTRERAEALLCHFEFDRSLWDSYPGSFSGGEKLRLNVARAMVKRPRLLLLDEPTASLDPAAKEKVRLLIEQLKHEGTTLLGIFHDLAFMQGLCDREYAIRRYH